jgi:hypothetical protein
MAACADRVAREYADLVAQGATTAQLCQTDRYHALAVAFKTTLLAALVYNNFRITPVNAWTVYSTVQILMSSSLGTPTLALGNVLAMFAASAHGMHQDQVRRRCVSFEDIFKWLQALLNSVMQLTMAKANQELDLVRMAHWLRSNRAAVNEEFKVARGMRDLQPVSAAAGRDQGHRRAGQGGRVTRQGARRGGPGTGRAVRRAQPDRARGRHTLRAQVAQGRLGAHVAQGRVHAHVAQGRVEAHVTKGRVEAHVAKGRVGAQGAAVKAASCTCGSPVAGTASARS